MLGQPGAARAAVRRGLGDLFIVRNASNVVDTAALGSIEYAVLELGVPLVVVLGHERCGAVAAAVSVVTENATFPGAIGRMVEPIVPAVLAAQAGEGALLENAVRRNVSRVVERLRRSEPVLTGPIAEGRLRVVGARYDLKDGVVDFFDEGRGGSAPLSPSSAPRGPGARRSAPR